jgi:hypothetical protein
MGNSNKKQELFGIHEMLEIENLCSCGPMLYKQLQISL